MEKEFYTCEYCFKEYIPKRRRIQKFCSHTCRSKAHHAKNSTKVLSKQEKVQINKPEIEKPVANKIEKMSPAGVGNAALGSFIAKKTEEFFKPHENKPATKADVAYLASKIKRYHKIVNHPPNAQGALPYFDLETNEIKYSFLPLNGKP